MNLPFWCAWYLVGDLAVPKLTASESAALIMLAASILVFRTFRERFLLVWSLGWLAYGVSQWFAADTSGVVPSPEMLGISQAAFVLAVCLFAVSILLYTHKETYILPLFVVTGTVMAYAVARVLYWPDEVLARLDTRQQAIIMGHAVPMPVVVKTRGYNADLYRSVGYVDDGDVPDVAADLNRRQTGGDGKNGRRRL